jgi:hypothetical protein
VDVWRDTTTLFTQILRGHVEEGAGEAPEVVAAGILHIHLGDFARQLTTFRCDHPTRIDALPRFDALFAITRDSFGGEASEVGLPEVAEMLDVRLVPFSAADGTELNLINVRGPKPPAKAPVLLVHGAGVRANIFRAPSGRTIVDELVDAVHDVWLENWRASIDIPHNRWTLDQAAVLDHPAAVRKVVEESGADEVKAVIHCQGSTSFMMSAVAGLVPEVTTVVSNAVALHPVVSRMARLKMDWVLPPAAKVLGYLNPQWG